MPAENKNNDTTSEEIDELLKQNQHSAIPDDALKLNENGDLPEIKANQFQQIKVLLSADTREETLEGNTYLVKPVVMLVEGVANNALYPAKELAKYPQAWNNRPLPIYHPKRNGTPVSANSPDLIASRSVGSVFNAKFEDGKLKAEAWIDKSKAEHVSPRLMEKINNNEIVEVSTGLFTDDIVAPGSFMGKEYNVIATNYRPDHLALLPDGTGACSVKDGAGLGRVNEEQETGLLKSLIKKLTSIIKEDVTEPKQQKQNENSPNKKDNVMDEKINALIANEQTHWTEDDREFLKGLDESQIDKMSPVEHKKEDPKQNDEKKEDEPKSLSLEDIQKAVKETMREELKSNERAPVLERLKDNDDCKISAETLEKMTQNELEEIEKTLMPKNYSGNGMPIANSNGDDSGPGPMGEVFPKEEK